MKTNGRAKAFVRLAVMAVLTINSALVLAGKNPIPFDEATFTEVLTHVVTGVSIIWTWWKNNNVTKEHCEKQGLADIAKGKLESDIDVEDLDIDEYDDEEDYDEEEEG